MGVMAAVFFLLSELSSDLKILKDLQLLRDLTENHENSACGCMLHGS